MRVKISTRFARASILLYRPDLSGPVSDTNKIKKDNRHWIVPVIIGVFCLVQTRVDAQTIRMAYCSTTYKETGQCPKTACRLTCADHKSSKDKKECPSVCLPEDCTVISAEQCPLEYCAVMVDCSDQKICHDPMKQEPPPCGELAYEGQDVECCEGLVKRCGIEFLEGFCDMEGKNSIYNLPVCIPCGNGICGQFENRCNCPEDCGEPFVPTPQDHSTDNPSAEKELPGNPK